MPKVPRKGNTHVRQSGKVVAVPDHNTTIKGSRRERPKPPKPPTQDNQEPQNMIAAIEKFAHETLKQYGLTEKGWKVEWMKKKSALGTCNYVNKTILLSATVLPINDFDVARNTVLHEVAHALAGPGSGHGNRWKTEAIRVGADPHARTEIPVSPEFKWIGICPRCGETIGRHRLTTKAKRVACRACCFANNGGVHTTKYVFTWEENPNK